MRLSLPFLSAGLTTALLAQGEPKQNVRARLDEQAALWLKEYDVPSVAVAYIEKGKLAWTAVYGEQSPGVPASPRTLYNVASLTKPVSAETILRLVSLGKIELDEPLSDYWVDPDVAQNPWHKLLTPRLGLSHQTGFTNWRYQTKNVLQFQWKPGTQTGYSGEGYDYVARFAEKKLGRSFEDLARQYVFEPIGMKETSFTNRPWHKGRIAHPHGPNVSNPPTAPANWTAADLLHTTIDDYAKFVVSVMHNRHVTESVAAQRHRPTRNTAKPEEVTRICTEAALTDCTGSAGMGLGWEVLNLNGETIIRHGGADPGVRTVALFVPAKSIGAVVFTNGQEGKKVIRKVVGLLYPNPMLTPIL